MAGTVVTTEETFNRIQKITFDWLSSAGGAADAVTTNYYTGEILRYVEVPDSGGTQPTNAYDVAVTDDDGVDVLAGLGADLSNAAASQFVAGSLGIPLGVVANAQLTLAVTGAGNAKGGQTILYIKKP